MEMVTQPPADFGDWKREYTALRESAGWIDLSARGRLCVTGPDRLKFLNGQVTNNVKDLKPGEGCYAALVSAKGKMQSDLNIYCLENELLLDFEPGYSKHVKERLEKYIIADNVEVVHAAPLYGMLRLQGPRAQSILEKQSPPLFLPVKPMSISATGETYAAKHHGDVFDIFAPTSQIESFAQRFTAAGAIRCGSRATEVVRIEDAIPRFGVDMDESNLPPEAGLENHAISYTKGCYIGQEVISRIRAYGEVAKALRGLRLADGPLPERGAKILLHDKEVGWITSVTESPSCRGNIALGYIRREANAGGTDLVVAASGQFLPAKIITVPFAPFTSSAAAKEPG